MQNSQYFEFFDHTGCVKYLLEVIYEKDVFHSQHQSVDAELVVGVQTVRVFFFLLNHHFHVVDLEKLFHLG